MDKKEKYHYIYLIENKLSGKQYIGQHTYNNLENNYFGSGIIIQNSIKKNGKENFNKEILEICNKDNINEKEIFWIKEKNTMVPIGYNLTKGGEGNLGWKPSKETKKRISNSSKGKKMDDNFKKRMKELSTGKNNPRYGKQLSKEIKDKIRNSLLGFKHTKETKDKMSKAGQ